MICYTKHFSKFFKWENGKSGTLMTPKVIQFSEPCRIILKYLIYLYQTIVPYVLVNSLLIIATLLSANIFFSALLFMGC
jgi:predicted membrane chloride channel (bestrophin family)